MNTEQSVEWELAGEFMYRQRNLPQCDFIPQKYLVKFSDVETGQRNRKLTIWNMAHPWKKCWPFRMF
jgi:hypothetical protein